MIVSCWILLPASPKAGNEHAFWLCLAKSHLKAAGRKDECKQVDKCLCDHVYHTDANFKPRKHATTCHLTYLQVTFSDTACTFFCGVCTAPGVAGSIGSYNSCNYL